MGELSAGRDRPDADTGAAAGWRNEMGGEVRGSAVQAQAIHGDVYFGGSRPERMPVPSQLPPPPGHFTGRVQELAALAQLAEQRPAARPVTLVVIVGPGGVGKTALASYWAHQVRGAYPAGRLYADLGGLDPGKSGADGRPAGPDVVLSRFLRALGVAPDRVPAALDEQSGLWRSLTDGRRMLLLLDNAASAAQVRALLPGPGESLVVVTTRRRLAGLAIDGAEFVELCPLDEDSAVELLSRIAGAGRVYSQPEAAHTVARLCGGLPLALCISAARLVPHPSWPVERLAGELAGDRRLSALSLPGDMSVSTAFDMSYRSLPPEAARAYRLLALIPGTHFGTEMAAAATATGQASTSLLLDTLVEASLLEETGDGGYRFHDLIRLHAREQADTGPPSQRRAAVARCVDWYLRTAVAADLTAIPGRWHLGGTYERARRAPSPFPSVAAALDWLEYQQPALLAALRAAREHAMHDKVWQLCEAQWSLLVYRRPYPHWLDAHTIGVASARACGDRRAEARMRIQLGFGHLLAGDHRQARDQFTKALGLDRAERHYVGEATALENLGLADLAAGAPDQAAAHFTQARAIHAQIGLRRGVALMTRRIGEAHRNAGHHQQAVGHLLEARGQFAELGDPYNEARTLTSLAGTYLRARRPGEAIEPLTEALATASRLGSRYEQARIHTLLADAASQLGDTAAERRHLADAAAAYGEASAAPEARQLRGRLAALESTSGQPAVTPTQNDTPAA